MFLKFQTGFNFETCLTQIVCKNFQLTSHFTNCGGVASLGYMALIKTNIKCRAIEDVHKILRAFSEGVNGN